MEMITVKHIVTKRFENSMRLVFEMESLPGTEKYKGELLLELRWVLGRVWNGSLGEYVLPSGHKKRFYVDIPAWEGILWSSFKWVFTSNIVFRGNVSAYVGKGKKVALYEDLRK